MIEPHHRRLSVKRQCGLLGLGRSSYYYRGQAESEEDLLLMRLLDEQYLRTPFYGSRRLQGWLEDQGYRVCRDHVRRLMRKMGLAAIYPKPRLSLGDQGHQKYPYLLRDLAIVRPNQVWATDITFIRLRHGFAYLTAIMDWFSRYVLEWELSMTLEASFCVDALDRALKKGKCDIFNSDQGSQFTSEDFTGRLKAQDIRISMDGRGRVFDNIMIERLWRSVKYEDVYLKDYEDFREALQSLAAYFRFYNNQRRHQSLESQTPATVYATGRFRTAG